jgi:hypothetical protein
MTRTHIHYVNSRNRFAHDDVNALTVRLPPDVLGRHISSVRLDSVQVEAGYYVVNSNNNSFSVVDGVGTQSIALPVGNYSSVTLPSALKTALDAGSNRTWTVTHSTLTGKLTFEADGSFTITNSANAGRWLGLGAGDSRTSLDGSAVGMPNITILAGPLYLDVVCSHHVGSSESGNPWRSNLLARVPAQVSSTAQTIFWSSQTITMSRLDTRSLGDLRLALLDDTGMPLELNGAHWAASLVIEYE